MLAARRVPNSLLFVGADGVGKKAFALETAKAFACRNPQQGAACDACGTCRRAENFVLPKADDRDGFKKVVFSEHPDIGVVLPYGKNILVEAIRDLEEQANFRPYEARARVFLIDDADKMNDAAANALLKTLEEPPATTHIFLITSRPSALLPTIRSRCQTLRFAPIETKQIESFLENQKQFSAADAELLSKLARGSIGRALNLDPGKWRERRDSMLKVLESLLTKKNRGALLKVSEEMNDAKNKDFYEEYLEILQVLIHDTWSLRLGRTEIVNADIRPQLESLAAEAENRKLALWLTEIETLRENFAVNLNRKIATDALFMQMAN
jgi:DNA polymerase III, gamma/tau subunits